MCLQETEEDLAEAEEYKEAKNMLDSVKLEGWFLICFLFSLWDSLASNVHSSHQAWFGNHGGKTESIHSPCCWCNYFYCLLLTCVKTSTTTTYTIPCENYDKTWTLLQLSSGEAFLFFRSACHGKFTETCNHQFYWWGSTFVNTNQLNMTWQTPVFYHVTLTLMSLNPLCLCFICISCL